jgi:glutathione S-transferase
VDFQFVTLIERIVATIHYFKGVDVRELYPGLDPWLDAFERLPYYMATKGDYYTHCMAIEPQYGKVYESNKVTATRVRTCVSPRMARLPVDPDVEFEEQWTDRELKTPIETHSIEAAWELVHNHTAIARYGCRAAGGDVGAWSQGDPYRSPLADPEAATNESLAEAVDVLLLAIATALFRQNPELAKGQAREAVAAAGPGSRVGVVVAACLEYILLRIGVPRDMSMPAAKCLRAYLSEVILDLR